MDKPSEPPAHPPPSNAGVSPLTQTRTKDGVPYVRREDVEAQICECLAGSTSALLPAALKSETLVHLLRRHQAGGDLDLIGKLVYELGRRVARIAHDFTSGLRKSEAEEFVVDVMSKVNSLIFAADPSRQSEFLEVSFRQAVRRHALKERAKVDERKSHLVVESTLRASDGLGGKVAAITSSEPDDKPGPEERLIAAEQNRLRPEQIRKSLAAITRPQHREAVILHFLEGWPIDSKVPGTPTLSTHFQMSGRQIQNWIYTALGEMRNALGGET